MSALVVSRRQGQTESQTLQPISFQPRFVADVIAHLRPGGPSASAEFGVDSISGVPMNFVWIRSRYG